MVCISKSEHVGVNVSVHVDDSDSVNDSVNDSANASVSVSLVYCENIYVRRAYVGTLLIWIGYAQLLAFASKQKGWSCVRPSYRMLVVYVGFHETAVWKDRPERGVCADVHAP
jgi:hypothetical protein